MNGLSLDFLLFLIATFAGAFVAGVSGFAFGPIAVSVWLFILPPAQTVALIISFGLIVQGYSVWKLRHAVDWKRLLPFVIGAAFGIPAGVAVLTWTEPRSVRAFTGAFLLLYSLYGLLRPPMKPVTAGGAAADAGVGFLNGVLAGLTGLAGILIVIWSGLRGWTKDQQRAVFQPAAVVIFLMTAAWLGFGGAINADFVPLVLFGLPVLLLGTWAGMRLYGRLDEEAFRKVVLVLLLISGAMLIL